MCCFSLFSLSLKFFPVLFFTSSFSSQVISIIGRTLESFDEDNLIPAFGFGDSVSKGRSVFSFKDRTAAEKAGSHGGGLGERLRLWGRRGRGAAGGGEGGEFGGHTPCKGFSEVLQQYEDIAQSITLGGPTDFAPIIHKAVEIVKKLKK